MTFRELLGETIVFSGNDTFNTLQECVGFGETYAEMKRWGVTKARIRRHFRVPRYNSSREVTVLSADGTTLLRLPPRPGVDIPIHDCNGHTDRHNPESNWYCTDDLVRTMAAVLWGPTRGCRFFNELTTWMGFTNQCRLRDGLRELTASDPSHPAFVILNKPGWWEPDHANVEMGYVYDNQQRRHYLVGLYYHGPFTESERAMPEACLALFKWLRSV
jgi:hypothetical protein